MADSTVWINKTGSLRGITIDNGNENLGKILKQRRIMMSLTLHKLASKSGVSPSYLGRVERGDRFPSARILRKLATPLGFTESELFAFADYLSTQFAENRNEAHLGNLDPNTPARYRKNRLRCSVPFMLSYPH